MSNSSHPPVIILCGGRTGGPLIPLMAIRKALGDSVTPIIAGIRNGFEQEIATSHGITMWVFPEAKLRLVTFSSKTPGSIIADICDAALSLIKFVWACVLAGYMLIRLRPRAVLSAGSFTAVPIMAMAKVCNMIGVTRTKLIVHQQDPEPGISNRITAGWTDMLTCVFSTSTEYRGFEKARIIPNPFDFEDISQDGLKVRAQALQREDTELWEFVSRPGKPLFLIFGGGSGSQFINDWVADTVGDLTYKFRVIHLTGTHASGHNIMHDQYIQRDVLTTSMRLIIHHSDLVMSRSGLGSITEYIWLKKTAFLVPIPHSHQELNARQVSVYFTILDQNRPESWLDIISATLKSPHQNTEFPDTDVMKKELISYYDDVARLCDIDKRFNV